MVLFSFLVPFIAKCRAFKNQDMNSRASPKGTTWMVYDITQYMDVIIKVLFTLRYSNFIYKQIKWNLIMVIVQLPLIIFFKTLLQIHVHCIIYLVLWSEISFYCTRQQLVTSRGDWHEPWNFLDSRASSGVLQISGQLETSGLPGASWSSCSCLLVKKNFSRVSHATRPEINETVT